VSAVTDFETAITIGEILKAMAASLGIAKRALYARFQRLGLRPRGKP
jgi:hypothetical protein